MIELSRQPSSGISELTIKVVGLGGAGGNALDRIQLDGLECAELIAVNTDSQALAGSVAPVKVQIGHDTTRGLGTGGDPELGYAAADEAGGEIRSTLSGASLIFICAGLGGGTGSGAAPLIANFARQQGALVVAFVTLPFGFEGRRRMAQAEEALASLRQQADVLICFENDRMAEIVNPRSGIQEAFAVADQTISQSVRAIATMLQRRGLIHAGFDELSTVLRGNDSRCLFGSGDGEGDNRAHVALERALRSPLMDRGRLLADTHSVMVHVGGGPNMTLNEVTILMEELNRHISDTTRVFFSTAVDPRLGNRMSVTLISSTGTELNVSVAPLRSATQAASSPIATPVSAKPSPQVEPQPAAEPEPEIEPKPPVIPRSIVPEIPLPALEATTPPHAVEAAPFEAGASVEARPGRSPKQPIKAKTGREEKQEQMLFEPVNRGRFEKSEPTIIDGQDLDVPAFMRMNVRVK